MQMQIGDMITFGRYPQDADGRELPIEWQVLDVQDGRALLLSRYILDVQPYAEPGGSLFWGESHLRAWLQRYRPARLESFESDPPGRPPPRSPERPRGLRIPGCLTSSTTGGICRWPKKTTVTLT